MTSQDTPPVALITGAAKRIGRAIALDMATYGWAIAVHYNSSPGEAEETRDAIRRAGARSEMVCANLADGSSLPGLIDDSIAALGPLGCLINNASIFEDDDLETMSEDSWKRHMMINLRAPVFLAQHFAARLEAPAHGAIIWPVNAGASRMKRTAAAISSGSGPRPRSVAATCRAKSVSFWRILGKVGPGATALTRMRGASACASVRVAVHSADLEIV